MDYCPLLLSFAQSYHKTEIEQAEACVVMYLFRFLIYVIKTHIFSKNLKLRSLNEMVTVFLDYSLCSEKDKASVFASDADDQPSTHAVSCFLNKFVVF